jgi:hypothetical protein
LLNKLLKEGMASSESQPAQGRGPAKRVYSATENGRTVLRDGVHACLADLQPGSKAFMLGLSCLPLLSREMALDALAQRKLALQARFSELQRHPALHQPGFPPHVKAMFTYSLPIIQAELVWLDQFIQEFTQGETSHGKDRSAQTI